MQEAVTEPETHRYPSNRGRPDFREAVADFYVRRFDVELDPATEIMPAIGAKECIFNLNLAFLDPGDAALSADPGYPVYTGGPLIAGGEPVLMPLLAERGFTPDLSAISDADRERAKLMFFNYPNNPTGAVVRPGFFEEVVDFAGANDILAVHDNAYSETVYDGYRAPSFLATPGAKDVGVEVFSLSKGYNMTGWRCAAIVGNAEAIEHYWRLKTNIDSGLFEAVQLAAIAALSPDADGDKKEMNALYARRRDLVVDALRAIGVDVTPPKGTIYIWAPVPAGFESAAAVLRARARAGRRRDLAGRGLRAQRRGLLPDLADDARRPPARGRRAPRPARPGVITRMRSVLPCAIVVLVACAAALPGCGSSDEDQVRAVAKQLRDALAKRDGAGACRLLAADAKAQLKGDCERAVLSFDPGKPALDGALTVIDDRASLGVQSDGRRRAIAFIKADGDWRVEELPLATNGS